MDWVDIGRAIGIVLFLEGLIPLLFPNRWCKLADKLAEFPPAQIQISGGCSLLIGLFIIYYFI